MTRPRGAGAHALVVCVIEPEVHALQEVLDPKDQCCM